MPLTREQFNKARAAGFSTEQIVGFEKRRLSQSLPIKEPESIGNRISKTYEQFKELPGIKQGDELVENVARFIEPEVPAGRTTFGLMTKDLPRQVGADFIRAYKPSTAIPFFGVAKAVKPVLTPAAKAIWKATPPRVKDFLLQEVTIGRGLPEKFLELTRKAKLERAEGLREAEDVGRVLTTAPHDIRIKTPQGNEIVVKEGQPLTKEHQRYIGRIFRKEIDLGGRESRILEPEDVTRRIAKNVEVEVAFNGRLKSLNEEFEQVNKALRNKEQMAQGLVGREFTTPLGGVEKVSGVTKESESLLSGKKLKPKVKLETEQIKPPSYTEQPPNFIENEGKVLRDVSQVLSMSPTNKFLNLPRKSLLQKRKALSNQIMKETMQIEENVKANYYVFDRRFTEQIRTHPRYQELSDIASKGRDVMDKWSNALVDSGIPKERASLIIQENVGEYMGRMYEKHLVKGISGFSAKNLRLRLDGLKHRKDLSSEVLKQMGEIKEPALPTAIRVKEISTSLANNKVFNAVAKNPEWTATKNLTGDMILMPKNPALGALSGKFVIKEIAQDINAITSLKLQNKALEFYSKGLQAWKYSKVVLNPATHSRNILANSILLDLSGVNHLKQIQLLPRVIKDYLSKGSFYQLALKNGAIGDEFVGGEVAMIEKFYTQGQGSNLDRWMNVLKSPIMNAGKVYQAEEQISKMIKFTAELERGKSASIAALDAQKWLFNYQEIPNFIKVAKQISPFITFTYKSVPRIAEAIVNNPLRVYKYYAFAKAFNESSRKMLNISPTDFAREEKALPPWLLRSIGGMPTNMLMPWKDKYGRTQWLNLEYILPVGLAPDILEKGILEQFSNPLFTIISDLKKNSDFRGKEIIPVGSTPAEAAKITTEYIYRQLAPSLAPGLLNLGDGESIFKGGYSFEKIMSALYEKPDYMERVRGITPVIFDVLMGLKLTPLDVDESEMFKMYEKKNTIEELTHQALKLNSPTVSEKTRDRGMEKIFQKIQKVLEE